MTFNEIENLLDAGFRVGFEKPTGDHEYLGWILLSKVSAHERLLEVMRQDESSELVREEKRRRSQPYLILRIELKRAVHEAGGYETEADYRQKERHWFGNLKDVAAQLEAWGYSLEDAKEARELDAP